MKTKSNAMKVLFLPVLIVLLALISCQKTENDQPEIPNLPEKSAQLIDADNAFASTFLVG